MKAITHCLLLVFVFFVFTCHSAPLAKNRAYCDAKNRPEANTCYTQPYVPTCAYYKENCPFEICGRPVSSQCDACSQADVLYSVPGDCKPEEVVNICNERDCNLQYNPKQDQVFAPVCGIRKGCTKGDCTTTFDNVCKACSAKQYGWYQDGVCADDKNFCLANQRNKNCNGVRGSPVCAFFKDQYGSELFTTARSGCDACRDANVTYYKAGSCGPMYDNNTYCLPNSRPQVCTKEYNPVCGFFEPQDNSGLNHRIIANPCNACQDREITYYQPGPCVFKCNRNPFLAVDCLGSFVQPICGSYQVNGTTKKVSLKSSCIGCHNSPFMIDTYTDGICPGDEGISCKNEFGGFAQGQIFPVCGSLKAGCNSASCRKTYAEPVVACGDKSVVFYNAGMCPGDEGISCDPYRSQKASDDQNGYVYQDVCGYTRKGCTGVNCRKTYTDQNQACGVSSVLFFTQGPCA